MVSWHLLRRTITKHELAEKFNLIKSMITEKLLLGNSLNTTFTSQTISFFSHMFKIVMDTLSPSEVVAPCEFQVVPLARHISVWHTLKSSDTNCVSVASYIFQYHMQNILPLNLLIVIFNRSVYRATCGPFEKFWSNPEMEQNSFYNAMLPKTRY